MLGGFERCRGRGVPQNAFSPGDRIFIESFPRGLSDKSFGTATVYSIPSFRPSSSSEGSTRVDPSRNRIVGTTI
jgi:hypothetical protein